MLRKRSLGLLLGDLEPMLLRVRLGLVVDRRAVVAALEGLVFGVDTAVVVGEVPTALNGVVRLCDNPAVLAGANAARPSGSPLDSRNLA